MVDVAARGKQAVNPLFDQHLVGSIDVVAAYGPIIIAWLATPMSGWVVARSASTVRSPAAPGMAPSAGTTTGAAGGGMAPTSATKDNWYPDHAVMSGTKDQLKALPAFKYSDYN